MAASLWPGPDGFQAGKRRSWSPAARTSSRAASPLSRQAALQSGGPVQSGEHVLSPPCARQSFLLGTSPHIQTSHPARVPSSTDCISWGCQEHCRPQTQNPTSSFHLQVATPCGLRDHKDPSTAYSHAGTSSPQQWPRSRQGHPCKRSDVLFPVQTPPVSSCGP